MLHSQCSSPGEQFPENNCPLSSRKEAASNIGRMEIIGVPKMAPTKQRNAAKRNIKKPASAAKRKRTIAHLPKSLRTALGKQGSSVVEEEKKVSQQGLRNLHRS